MGNPSDQPLTKSALEQLNQRLAQIPPHKRFVLVGTGHLENGIPSGKIGWATRTPGGALSIGNEWELKLKQKPSTNVWIGIAFAMLMMLSAVPAFAQNTMTGPISATQSFVWEAPANVTTAAEALTFEWRINEGPTPLTALTNVTCAPAVAPIIGITCRSQVGASSADAVNRVGRHQLTIKSFRTDVGESVASLPFTLTSPAGAATGLRIQ